MDFDAGTDSRGALFEVDPDTGLRSYLSDFGDAAQGALGVEPASFTIAAPVVPKVPHTLTVSKVGSGTVSSAPAGIDCGKNCGQVYPFGQLVVLSAPSNANALFLGWDGDPDCLDGSVTMNADRSCVAIFVKRKGPTLRPNLKFDKRPKETYVDLPRMLPIFPFDVTRVVQNTGFYFRGPFRVRWYFSVDRKLSQDDVLLEDYTAAFSSPGAPFGLDYRSTTRRIRNSLIPADTPGGFYYFIGVIDPDDEIEEQNENDNQIELRVEIFSLAPPAN
jgi:hypothetical protein